MSVSPTTQVLAEIGEERARQEHQHGRDPEDDDRLMLAEWAWLIAHRAHELSCPRPDEYVPHPEPRRALIEIAAISVAAIESWDRRHPRDSS
jgi:hypothetical protein